MSFYAPLLDKTKDVNKKLIIYTHNSPKETLLCRQRLRQRERDSLPGTQIMNKLIALVGGLALLLQAIPVTAAPPPSVKSKTFAQWCQQRNSVPAATKLTIDVLLKEANTKNCKLANSRLKNISNLSIFENKISDLQPLSGLTKLESLDLRGNKIRDLAPLIGLTII
jgi:Leucine-rich repeat (LRR) protein